MGSTSTSVGRDPTGHSLEAPGFICPGLVLPQQLGLILSLFKHRKTPQNLQKETRKKMGSKPHLHHLHAPHPFHLPPFQPQSPARPAQRLIGRLQVLPARLAPCAPEAAAQRQRQSVRRRTPLETLMDTVQELPLWGLPGCL
jgi:hypothetical protein